MGYISRINPEYVWKFVEPTQQSTQKSYLSNPATRVDEEDKQSLSILKRAAFKVESVSAKVWRAYKHAEKNFLATAFLWKSWQSD